MKVNYFEFGKLVIDDEEYAKDIIISKGKIKKRNKKASKRYRSQYGHTPVSVQENIPWDCKTLIIGTGQYGSLPVMKEVNEKAEKLGVGLLLRTTPEALNHINDKNTNFILHLTC